MHRVSRGRAGQHLPLSHLLSLAKRVCLRHQERLPLRPQERLPRRLPLRPQHPILLLRLGRLPGHLLDGLLLLFLCPRRRLCHTPRCFPGRLPRRHHAPVPVHPSNSYPATPSSCSCCSSAFPRRALPALVAPGCSLITCATLSARCKWPRGSMSARAGAGAWDACNLQCCDTVLTLGPWKHYRRQPALCDMPRPRRLPCVLPPIPPMRPAPDSTLIELSSSGLDWT